MYVHTYTCTRNRPVGQSERNDVGGHRCGENSVCTEDRLRLLWIVLYTSCLYPDVPFAVAYFAPQVHKYTLSTQDHGGYHAAIVASTHPADTKPRRDCCTFHTDGRRRPFDCVTDRHRPFALAGFLQGVNSADALPNPVDPHTATSTPHLVGARCTCWVQDLHYYLQQQVHYPAAHVLLMSPCARWVFVCDNSIRHTSQGPRNSPRGVSIGARSCC